MENTNLSQNNFLAYEVDVDLNMLGTTMMDGVGGHIDSTNIVAVDDCRQREPRCAAPEEVVIASSTRAPHGPQHGTPPQHWSGTP